MPVATPERIAACSAPNPARRWGSATAASALQSAPRAFARAPEALRSSRWRKSGCPSSFASDPTASLTVRVLDTVLPISGPTLDCPTLLAGVDAGSLDIDDPMKVNALLAPYSVSLSHLSSGQQVTSFEVQSVPSGGMPLLLIEGFLTRDLDGGADAIGCAGYSAVALADGGPPTVGLELGLW